DLLEEAGVEVDGGHVALWAHRRAEPAGDRAASAADLQAAPSRPDADVAEPADRGRVVAGLQEPQPVAGPVPGVVERVAGGGHGPTLGPASGRTPCLSRQQE